MSAHRCPAGYTTPEIGNARRGRTAVASIALLALFGAACGSDGDGDADTTTTTEAGATVDDDATTTTTEAVDSDSVDATTTTVMEGMANDNTQNDATEDDADDAGTETTTTVTVPEEDDGVEEAALVDLCVIGTWKLDNESFAQTMEELFSATGMPAQARVSGDDFTRFTVTEGDEPSLEVSFLQSEWSMAFTFPEGEASFVMNASQSGVFGTTTDDEEPGGFLWISETEVEYDRVEAVLGEARVELEDGAPGSVEIFDFKGAVPAEVPELIDGVASYVCNADELLLTSSVDKAEFADDGVDASALPDVLTARLVRASWPTGE